MNRLQRQVHQTQLGILPVLQQPPVPQHQEQLISGTGFFPMLATMVFVANDLLAIVKQQVLPWELAAIICCSKMMKTSFGAKTMGYRTTD